MLFFAKKTNTSYLSNCFRSTGREKKQKKIIQFERDNFIRERREKGEGGSGKKMFSNENKTASMYNCWPLSEKQKFVISGLINLSALLLFLLGTRKKNHNESTIQSNGYFGGEKRKNSFWSHWPHWPRLLSIEHWRLIVHAFKKRYEANFHWLKISEPKTKEDKSERFKLDDNEIV